MQRRRQWLENRLAALNVLMETSPPPVAVRRQGRGDPSIIKSSKSECLPVPSLTRREREVLEWLQQGKTSPEIGIILGCATRTVEKHVQNLYRKLGVSDRTSMILNSEPADRS